MRRGQRKCVYLTEMGDFLHVAAVFLQKYNLYVFVSRVLSRWGMRLVSVILDYVAGARGSSMVTVQDALQDMAYGGQCQRSDITEYSATIFTPY